MIIFEFIILALASFRFTRLIVFDQITSFIRKPFFTEEEVVEQGELAIYYTPYPNGIRGWIGELLNCYWCTGIWVAMIVYTLYFFFPYVMWHIMLIMAIAAVAAIVESILQKLIN